MTVRRVPVGAIELSCDIRGEGKPIVFIHGNACTRQTWRPQREYFARAYRVIAPDLRGHGDSDKPGGAYPMSAFVADVVGLLDALAIDEAVMAGHSMGGRVVMSFALEHPARVSALVLAGTSATSFSKANEQIERVRALGLERELQEFIEFESSPDTPDELKRELLREALKTPERVRVELWKTVSGFDVSKRLGHIGAPTLIIVGDLDRGTPVAAARQLNEGIRGSRLVVIGGVAHFTQLERPETVNQHIEAFLRDVVRYT